MMEVTAAYLPLPPHQSGTGTGTGTGSGTSTGFLGTVLQVSPDLLIVVMRCNAGMLNMHCAVTICSRGGGLRWDQFWEL